jgi:hypothetical protein
VIAVNSDSNTPEGFANPSNDNAERRCLSDDEVLMLEAT